MFGFMEPGTRSVPHIGRAFAFVGSTRGPHVARDTRNDSSRDESRPPHRREVIFRVDPNRERFSKTGFGLPEHRWTGHARRMCRRHRSGAGGQRCQCVRLTPCPRSRREGAEPRQHLPETRNITIIVVQGCWSPRIHDAHTAGTATRKASGGDFGVGEWDDIVALTMD